MAYQIDKKENVGPMSRVVVKIITHLVKGTRQFYENKRGFHNVKFQAPNFLSFEIAQS